MHRLALVPILLASCLGCSETDDGSIAPPPPPPPPPSGELTLALQPVVSGLEFPLALTAPAGDPRLFIVEKGGRIRVVKSGQLLATPFLDIRAKVSGGGEQGLLGLAFHPRYATNGVFVVNYTDPDGDTRIATYKVSANADVANPASETIVLAYDQPFSNHNGGHVAFGPDGMLYSASGDGGSAGDPQGNGQDRNDLLGSLIRLEIRDDGSAAIPADNPFVGMAGARGELWDWGLRNPWRFAFDRTTGDLYIADVGQGQREEINVATAASGRGKGLNYGWARYEGTRCYAVTCSAQGVTMPVLEYTHDDGCSVTGGYVYRGTAIAGLQGTYFYSDYCNGWVRSFRYVGGNVTEKTEWSTLKPGGAIPSYGEDAAGELYIMNSNGGIWRIVRGN